MIRNLHDLLDKLHNALDKINTIIQILITAEKAATGGK